MGKVDVLKETTPLSSEDCFLVMQRPKSGFNFPLHVHMEFELNYLENAAGAIRIVGDSVEEIDDLDLNFNRVFKRRRGSTPTEYREKYSRSRFII